MRRRLTTRPAACLSVAAAWLLAALLAAFGALVPAAYAAGEATGDIPEITDRYAHIDNLSNSNNPDERVIIDTTTSVLTSVNRALNGLSVRFSGEAVGDVLAADEGHKWVNILGASGASIGVYMTDEQAKSIVNLGDYHTTGTTVEVEGTYTMACTEHQGELDVHATSIKVLDTGGSITRVANQQRFVIAIVLCVFGFAILGTFIFLRRKSEAKRLAEKEKERNR